jgi:hypothetical protein
MGPLPGMRMESISVLRGICGQNQESTDPVESESHECRLKEQGKHLRTQCRSIPWHSCFSVNRVLYAISKAIFRNEHPYRFFESGFFRGAEAAGT